jgi:AcrR family transcriptional regulator
MSRNSDGQRSANATGRETQQILIWTAEQLFAEQGIDAVSLRQISVAAGLKMTGVVKYHFGDKAGLIRAIIDERTIQFAERCRQGLAELEEKGLAEDLRAATEVIVRASLPILEETSYFFRFLAQLDRHPQAIAELQDTEAFRAAPARILNLQETVAGTHLPPWSVEHRRRLVTHMVIASFADLEVAARPHHEEERYIADLVNCVVALYLAPGPDRDSDGPPVRRRRRTPKATSRG